MRDVPAGEQLGQLTDVADADTAIRWRRRDGGVSTVAAAVIRHPDAPQGQARLPATMIIVVPAGVACCPERSVAASGSHPPDAQMFD
jgi:hypothetical protein